ncbi:hypothetical protein HHK36_002657 [Tetracentron sinense]|uniref:Uncharacterized protein n=1 Tax=Tetracentron sinense TaxID=13715 RepID=A0A834ZMK3_TETSI|nr:hypothetical protein HHK36_002657 [Tetracentron sinense]
MMQRRRGGDKTIKEGSEPERTRQHAVSTVSASGVVAEEANGLGLSLIVSLRREERDLGRWCGRPVTGGAREYSTTA